MKLQKLNLTGSSQGCCGSGGGNNTTNIYVFVIGNQTMMPSGLVPQHVMDKIPGNCFF